jgi:hypothetical protein
MSRFDMAARAAPLTAHNGECFELECTVEASSKRTAGRPYANVARRISNSGRNVFLNQLSPRSVMNPFGRL